MVISLVVIMLASLYLAGSDVYERVKEYEKIEREQKIEQQKKNNIFHYKYYLQKAKELVQ